MKKCPLISVNNLGQNTFTMAACDTDCAWWNAKDKCCVMVTIAKFLYKISEKERRGEKK